MSPNRSKRSHSRNLRSHSRNKKSHSRCSLAPSSNREGETYSTMFGYTDFSRTREGQDGSCYKASSSSSSQSLPSKTLEVIKIKGKQQSENNVAGGLVQAEKSRQGEQQQGSVEQQYIKQKEWEEYAGKMKTYAEKLEEKVENQKHLNDELKKANNIGETSVKVLSEELEGLKNGTLFEMEAKLKNQEDKIKYMKKFSEKQADVIISLKKRNEEQLVSLNVHVKMVTDKNVELEEKKRDIALSRQHNRELQEQNKDLKIYVELKDVEISFLKSKRRDLSVGELVANVKVDQDEVEAPQRPSIRLRKPSELLIDTENNRVNVAGMTVASADLENSAVARRDNNSIVQENQITEGSLDNRTMQEMEVDQEEIEEERHANDDATAMIVEDERQGTGGEDVEPSKPQGIGAEDMAVGEEDVGLGADETGAFAAEEPVSIRDQFDHGEAALNGRLGKYVVWLKDEEKFKFECGLCSKKYCNMGNTKRHIKAKHVNDI